MESSSNHSASSNIKPISLDKRSREKTLLARLPKPINCIRKEGNAALTTLLEKCFSSIDDTLFELAKNAEKQNDQDDYFFAMREIRSQKKSIKDTFIKAINTAYSQLSIPNDSNHSAIFTHMTIDELSVVGNDDLDEIVAKEALATRAIALFEHPLKLLSSRINSVVLSEVDYKHIPIGPNSLCDFFSAAVKTVSINTKSTLVLFKIYEQTLLNHLGTLYNHLNSLLHDRGILPEKNTNIPQSNDRAPIAHDGTGGLHMPIVTCDPIFPENPNLIVQQNVGDLHEPSSLFDLLSQQKTQNNLVEHTQKTTRANFLSHSETTLEIDSKEKSIVSILQKMFTNADKQAQMTNPVKSLFQRLHTPLAKLAITDKTFLNNPNHSARRLLNTLFSTAMRCDTSDINTLKTDPVYLQIKDIVDALTHLQSPTNADYSRHLNQLNIYSENEKKSDALLEKHLILAEKGRLQSLKIERTALETIAEVCQGMEIKSSVHEIIQKAWKNVMIHIGLKYGIESNQWDDALQTLINLVTSTQTFANEVDLDQAEDSLKDLKTDITKGLLSISYDTLKTEKLLQSLENTFSQLINSHSSSETKFNIASQSTTQNQESTPDLDINSNKERQTISEIFCNQAKNLSRGTWFDILIEGTKSRCRLAAIIAPYDQYIFVDRNGVKVTDKSLEEVALMLETQTLIHLDSSHIFDSALEQVISGIKNSPKKVG